MQKLIWGILLGLFIIDIIKKNSIKEETIKEPTINEIDPVPKTEIIENIPSRVYSDDKAIVDIKYWYLFIKLVKILILNILKI